MKNQLFHFLSTAATMLALCCSCVEEIEPYGDLAEPQPLVFTASQGDMTFSTRAAADGTWEGDGTEFVAIQVGSKVKKYKVTSSDGTLEPVDSDNTFYRSDKNNIEISAWYPYKDNQLSQPSKPNILIDQSNKANREASNLMTATATAKFGETTSLEFKHQTARLRLLLYGEDDKPLAAGTTVKFSGSTTWITAYNEGNGYYSALLAPLTISKGANFLQIITSVGTYKAKTPAEITLTAGQSYEFSYSLKRDLVNTSGIEVTLSETELEYSGNAQTPTVSVKYNGTELTQGTDYTLAWSNSSSKSIGSYTVTVTGKGAYIGTVEKTYSIVEAPPYLTFTASSAQTFTMTLPTDETAAASIGTFEYSVSGGMWTKVTSGEAVSFGGNKGNLRLRGTGLNSEGKESFLGTANGGEEGKYSAISFGGTAPVAASGDIRTLINGKRYATVSTSSAKFCYLFKGCTVLTSAPELPAETLAEQCYRSMFDGCKNLKNAPTISVKTLGRYCCYNMFKDCIALEAAPALPVEKLENYCYSYMFNGCTSLKTAPELPAKTLADGCYWGMFYGCTGLSSAPKLEATTLAGSCYYYMFYGCTSLKTAPELPAKALEDLCYRGMFYKCSGLSSAPKLEATTLAKECYCRMFNDCTNLKTAPELPATELKEDCYSYMFYNCTSLTKGPELPAKTLADGCYYAMFDGCTNLQSVTIKATDISATYAVRNWLQAFNNETTNPARIIYKNINLKESTLKSAGGIPAGWKCEDDVPKSFYVEAVTDGAEVSMTGVGSYAPTIYLLYSTDGSTWEDFTVGSTSITLSKAGDKVWFKAGSEKDANITSNKQLGYSTSSYNAFSFSKNVNVGGDITSLISADGAVSDISSNSYGTYTFSSLFRGSTTLISAEKLSLPCTTLKKFCYAYMFCECTALTSAPELPAENLAMQCYSYMFDGCKKLSKAPKLSAATLQQSCYSYMFRGCTDLEVAPDLGATTLESSCYSNMFRGCSKLTKAPELPAKNLKSSCYSYMFYGCTSLKSVTIKATTKDNSASWVLASWLSERASSDGVIYYSEDATLAILTDTSAIPTGWTATKIAN